MPEINGYISPVKFWLIVWKQWVPKGSQINCSQVVKGERPGLLINEMLEYNRSLNLNTSEYMIFDLSEHLQKEGLQLTSMAPLAGTTDP